LGGVRGGRVLFFSKQHVLHKALQALGGIARVQFDVDLAQM
jgi:stalled ribosome rescue protein Dom34